MTDISEGAALPALRALVGQSASLRAAVARALMVAKTPWPVLITGESGTGKEIVARTLHAHGPHSAGPFLVTNLGAIPRQLLESELFGHMRGAFTGAVADRKGLLLRATGGSLFLDEVADMPLDVQAKLLRALQQRSLRALGQREEVPFNARIIAATSRDLEQEVAAGRFRQDLYFRLNVIQLVVPPLRERGHDVLLLAQHFIQRESSALRPVVGLTPGAARALLAYRWPGNVRELKNAVHRVLVTPDRALDTDSIPDLAAAASAASAMAGAGGALEPLRVARRNAADAFEKHYVEHVLKKSDGNVTRAASLAEVSRQVIHKLMAKHGL